MRTSVRDEVIDLLRPEVIEQLFDIVDETSIMISAEMQTGYLQGMVESCQNIISQEIRQNVNAQIKEVLQENYDILEELEFVQEEVRKALQLAILKGFKADRVANAAMTPDSIAFMVSYFLAKLMKDLKECRIGDFAVGTGNFLTAVLNQMGEQPQAIFGVDPDQDLLQVAYVLSDMQEHGIQFYQQSSLKPLFIDPLDAIICDLPVGDAQEGDLLGADLELARVGSAYLPYLLMENHLRYLKPGGYGIYVIPNDLFNQPYSNEFHQLLTKSAHIQALIQLPASLFLTQEAGKSLFIFQKQGEGIQPIKEILIAQLPSFSDSLKVTKMLDRIENWILANK